MDEILIEEKKYVSSKRAAKATGYAKDYIGQLCREGRVPARLVGRSWYVLESAIQDHRFGEPREERGKTAKPQPAAPQPTWEAPRYSAAEVEILPSVNRLRSAASAPEFTTKRIDGESEAPQNLQETWQAWFDRFDHIAPAAEAVTPAESAAAEPAVSVEPEPEPEPERVEAPGREDVSIPIRAIHHPQYQPPAKEAAPPQREEEPPQEEHRREEQEPRKRNSLVMRSIQLSGVLFAGILAIAAVIGTGLFDGYIISSGQWTSVAGVALYNR